MRLRPSLSHDVQIPDDNPSISNRSGRRHWSVEGLRLRLLPLSLAMILIATAVPIELRAARGWDGQVNAVDFLQNLLLFAPLGIALASCSVPRVLAVALAVSIGVEALQIWQFDRFPSPFDVLSNVLGALLAATVARGQWARRANSISIRPWLLVTATLASLALLALWQLPARSSAIAEWRDDYSLMLGNETTGNRPWRGAILSLAIWNRALQPEQARIDLAHSATSRDRLYADTRAQEFDGGSATHLGSDIASEIVRRTVETGTFTVAVRLVPDNVIQEGPARVVSFSRDTQSRNFDLGQMRDRLVFRVRSAVSGPNGEYARAETGSVLTTGRSAYVVATYDGAVARIYVDGKPQARSNIAAAGCRISALCESALPIAWSALGGVMACLLLPYLSPNSRRTRVALVCLSAGVTLVLFDWILKLTPQQIAAPPWVSLSPLLGAMSIAIAYERAESVSTRSQS